MEQTEQTKSILNFPSVPLFPYFPSLLFRKPATKRLTNDSRTRGAAFGQSFVTGRPVDVREEGFDVFRAVRRRVIADERVLPHVHDQDRIEARDIARLVQMDPVIRQPPGARVQITGGPSHATHLADGHESLLPVFKTAEARFGGLVESRTLVGVAAAAVLHIPEIPLVQNHAVVFE